jgi:hypothetical protein
MESRATGGIVTSAIASVKAESSFRSSIPFAKRIVRLTKGIHRVAQHTDNDVGFGKLFHNVGHRLGSVGGRDRRGAVRAVQRVRDRGTFHPHPSQPSRADYTDGNQAWIGASHSFTCSSAHRTAKWEPSVGLRPSADIPRRHSGPSLDLYRLLAAIRHQPLRRVRPPIGGQLR